LKRAAEIAKIDLSRNERVTLETCKFEDDHGEEIEFECELTRGELIQVCEPIILRSAEICRRVLNEQKIGKETIKKVILVGGPTLAPYFRQILESTLGIPLDHSADPLTVVARGAAVFAGTQRRNARSATPLTVGEYHLELAKSFKPVGLDSSPFVGGKVSGASEQDFTGFTVEIINSKTQWRSGKVALRADGVFVTNLHAEYGERNTYTIELFDANGRKQKLSPATITYTIMVGGDVEQPLINSMGIALANNEYDKLFEKGRGLPLRATRDYQTIKLIRHGHPEDVFRIPVVEGENEKADRNRLNGSLEINGGMIRRDLPQGSDVEVTLTMDESRILTVRAYLPLLDEEFAAKIEMQRHQPNPDELQKDYEAEMRRFREVKSKALAAGGKTAERLVAEVETTPLVREVQELLVAAKTDPTAALQAEKRLLELKLKLDEAADTLEWPTLRENARACCEDLQKVAQKFGNDQQKEKAENLAEEVEDLIREERPERLRKKIEQMVRLYLEIVVTQPGWWVGQFQYLEEQQDQMSHPEQARRLLSQGRECIIKNNLAGLQNVVRQLWELLTDEEREKAMRGYGATIMRR
jgi:molecular chaperone DnaK